MLELRDTLVFKGGTALKKCYFGEYRFSEDLDFSGVAGVATGDDMEGLISRACDAAHDLLDDYAAVQFRCERYREIGPHPRGQEAFRIRAMLPWHSNFHTSIKIEVTVDEQVLWPFERRMVIHGYGEPLDTALPTYALEEVVAEKLRASLQQLERMEFGRELRTRPRDYYDLWRVLGAYWDNLDLVDFPARLHEKCNLRGVDFEESEDFFDRRVVAEVERGWENALGPLVPGLPPVATIMNELRPQIAALL